MSDVRTLSSASTVDNIRAIFGNAVSRYIDVKFPFHMKFFSELSSLFSLKNTGYHNFSYFFHS